MTRLSSLVLLCSLAMLNTGCVALVAGGAVGAGAMIATDSRTAGTMIDDESIEIRSLTIVSNNREIYNQSKIDVTSVNGRVLLTGQCKDEAYIKYVEENIAKLPQVREVINRIARIETVDINQKARDSWITTKVKTQLLFGKEINSGRFKVVTENNTVYLLGIVTKDEANRAVNVTRRIEGVVKVVKIFEYMSDVSKAGKIFNESSNDLSRDVASSDGAVVSSASENTPIYYEEVQAIEQPTITAINSEPIVEQVELNPAENNVINPQPITSEPVPTMNIPASSINHDGIAPAGSGNNVQDEYFIIE